MKKTVLLMAAAMVCFSLQAQKPLISTTVGDEFLYQMEGGFGADGTGPSLTIAAVEGAEGNMTVKTSYKMQMMGQEQVVASSIRIADGKMLFSPAAYLNMPQGQGIELVGQDVVIPLQMKAGDELPAYSIVMKMNFQGQAMESTMKSVSRKCEAIESVTVPAGTFNCYKIVESVSRDMMGQANTSPQTTWYAEGVGIVKQQSQFGPDMTMTTTLKQIKKK